jgi:phosphomannomutase
LDVLDLGLSTTPTVEMAVVMEGGVGGIVLTASHNPREWNALKLLNHRGEFINGADGAELLQLVGGVGPTFADVGSLGVYRHDDSFIARHIEAILALPLTDAAQIRSRRYKVVVDAVNSTGAISVPPLLEALGCEVLVINGEINGQFAHNPEPLKEHLEQLSAAVRENRADFGIAVDPDVDRLVRRRKFVWGRVHAGSRCRLCFIKIGRRTYRIQFVQ